jgi:hypothetical protein
VYFLERIIKSYIFEIVQIINVLLITGTVIKFVSDLQQGGGFLPVFWFPPPIKLTATI